MTSDLLAAWVSEEVAAALLGSAGATLGRLQEAIDAQTDYAGRQMEFPRQSLLFLAKRWISDDRLDAIVVHANRDGDHRCRTATKSNACTVRFNLSVELVLNRQDKVSPNGCHLFTTGEFFIHGIYDEQSIECVRIQTATEINY